VPNSATVTKGRVCRRSIPLLIVLAPQPRRHQEWTRFHRSCVKSHQERKEHETLCLMLVPALGIGRSLAASDDLCGSHTPRSKTRKPAGADANKLSSAFGSSSDRRALWGDDLARSRVDVIIRVSLARFRMREVPKRDHLASNGPVHLGVGASSSGMKRYAAPVILDLRTGPPVIFSRTVRSLVSKLRRAASCNCSAISSWMLARVSDTPHFGHQKTVPVP
jgi:hypothetical protein